MVGRHGRAHPSFQSSVGFFYYYSYSINDFDYPVATVRACGWQGKRCANSQHNMPSADRRTQARGNRKEINDLKVLVVTRKEKYNTSTCGEGREWPARAEGRVKFYDLALCAFKVLGSSYESRREFNGISVSRWLKLCPGCFLPRKEKSSVEKDVRSFCSLGKKNDGWNPSGCKKSIK